MSIMNYLDAKPIIGKNSWIAPGGTIVIGDVTLGEDVSIWFGSIVRGDVNKITIGDRTNIQDLCVVHVTHFKKSDKSDGFLTTIGSDVTIGHKVILHGCTIENGSLIGMGCTIMDGAVIGQESIVGAGSLVTKNKIFPKQSLIMGVPAKFIRKLTKEEVAQLYSSAKHYVGFKNNYLNPETKYYPD